MADTKQLEDFEMFPGLRHDAVVGGDHEHSEVDAGGPGKHVLDEPLVPGYIDDAEAEVAQIEPRKADVDRDPAFFFLGQAVAIDSGQGFHERSLAVVDVTGGAKDEVTRHEVSVLIQFT